MIDKVVDGSLKLGVCYYPEHWPKRMWEDDFKKMKEYGIQYVRMGEFAWNYFEPKEGVYDFTFFDDAVDKAGKYGLKVIMCTPTATPPIWISENYPEILNADKTGVIMRHGMRRHTNYNSDVYNEYSAKIVTEMAKHYSRNPNIVMWQIDNELNCEINVFYSDSDHKKFRTYLKQKYKTIEELNEAWGTIFWNQSYQSFDQIYLSRPTPADSSNPHLMLEEKKFISHSAINYCKMQANIIRRYCPEVPITTNGMFGHLDNHKMTKDCLDFYSYDSYPAFAFSSDSYDNEEIRPSFNDRWSSMKLCLVRSISENFCIMEQQSSAGGWVNRMKMITPKPGQMRLWTWQSLAHGADIISYFRWRTCTFGTEIYWHGINNYGNEHCRRLDELKKISDEIEAVKQIAGSKYQAEVALIKEYANEWDGEFDIWHGPLSSESESVWFKALQMKHIPMDIKYINDDVTAEELLKYKLLVFPHAAIMTKKTAYLFSEYCKKGGKLIFGCRSGYKDEFGRCYMDTLPSVLKGIAGVEVEDFTATSPKEEANHIMFADKQKAETKSFVDILRPTSASVIATYEGDYYDGKPAVTVNKVGYGQVIYYGSGFTHSAATWLVDYLGIKSKYDGVIELPEEVELAVRDDYIILLNYKDKAFDIKLGKEFYNAINGEKLEGIQKIDPFGVFVLSDVEN